MRPVLAMLVLMLGACQTTPAPPTLAGAWRLLSYTDTPNGGETVQAFGAEPTGMFIFTEDGQASISLMRNPPGPDADAPADPDPDACDPTWYCSYFGSYDVDWSRHEWTIHVEGGNIPSFIGADQTRPFRLEGERLIISTTYEADGVEVRAERILERAR